MKRLNDATPEEWDSAHAAMYKKKEEAELTYEEWKAAQSPTVTIKEKLEAPALARQVGGNHYKSMSIQPAIFNHKNNIGYLLGTAIAYLAREGTKDIPLSDVKKAIHTLQMYVEMEENRNVPSNN